MCMASIVMNLIYVAENFRETPCKVLEIEIASSRRRLSCFLKRCISKELMFPRALPLSSRWNRSICLHVWKDADAPLIRLLAFPRSFISTAWVSVWHIWLPAVSVCVCVCVSFACQLFLLSDFSLFVHGQPGLAQWCNRIVMMLFSCESSNSIFFHCIVSSAHSSFLCVCTFVLPCVWQLLTLKPMISL